MKIQKKIWIGCTAGLLSLLIAGTAIYRVTESLIETSSWVAHTYQVETLLEAAIKQLNDAETGQRGYLLTGDLTYLAPYENGISKIDSILSSAKLLTRDNLKQQAHIIEIMSLVEDKLSELKETIDLHQAGNHAAALGVIATDRGKHLMDKIRATIQVMTSEEELLLTRRMQASDTAIRNAKFISTIGVTAAVFFFAVIAIFIGRRTDRYIHERDEAELKLELLVNKLEQSLSEIKTLKGIIPICSYCKVIRNDDGAWEKLEAYIVAHSDAQFSHGICPDCMPKVRAEMFAPQSS